MTPDDPNTRPPYTYLRRGRWFWEPPPRLRGPTHKVQALGADQAVAWDVARRLNRSLAGDGAATPGSVRWLFSQFEASEKFAAKAESTKKDYRWLGRLLSEHRVGGVGLGDLPARALKPRHVDRIHAEIAKERGAATGHYACRYARRVWNWGRRQEAVTENPWAGMELAGLAAREQRWTLAQVDAAMAQAVEMQWPSMALAIRLAWRLGLREQDVLGLTWTQVEQRNVGTRKTGAAVPIVVDAYPDLAAALAQIIVRRCVPAVAAPAQRCERIAVPSQRDPPRPVLLLLLKDGCAALVGGLVCHGSLSGNGWPFAAMRCGTTNDASRSRSGSVGASRFSPTISGLDPRQTPASASHSPTTV